jgi:hypothetical protein
LPWVLDGQAQGEREENDSGIAPRLFGRPRTSIDTTGRTNTRHVPREQEIATRTTT